MGLYWLGLVHYHLGNLKEAKGYYNKLLGINPDFKIIHYQLGVINNRLELYKEAIDEFEKFLKVDLRLMSPKSKKN